MMHIRIIFTYLPTSLVYNSEVHHPQTLGSPETLVTDMNQHTS